MKKIFTLIAFGLTSMFASAQGVDLAVDGIFYNTNAAGEYMSDNAGPVSIIWSNPGTAINAGDTVFAFISVNGATLAAPGFLAPAGGIPTGTVDTLNYHATTTLPQQQFATTYNNLNLLGAPDLTIGGTPVGPNREIRAHMEVYPVGSNGTQAPDDDTTNDTATLAYTLVDGDFAASNLEVVFPAGAVNSNDEINVGTTIDTVSFVWTNNSPLPLLDFISTFERDVNGNIDTISLQLPRIADAAGAFTGVLPGTGGSNTLTINVPIDAASLPTGAGAFDICLASIYSSDANAADNKTCRTFTYVSPNTVREIEAETFNAFHAQDALNVRSNFANNTEIRVTNISGQLVYNGFVQNGLNTIELDQPAGVYIVTVGDAAQKVVIK